MDGIQVNGAQTLFEIGPIAITQTVISLIVVTAILMFAAIALGRNLQKRPGKLQVLTEKVQKQKQRKKEAQAHKRNVRFGKKK